MLYSTGSYSRYILTKEKNYPLALELSQVVKDLNLVGKAKIVFFSNDTKKGSVLKLWNLHNSIRLERTFKGL